MPIFPHRLASVHHGRVGINFLEMTNIELTPKEKASELMDVFFNPSTNGVNGMGSLANASMSAAFHVRELLKEFEDGSDKFIYYKQVLIHLIPDWKSVDNFINPKPITEKKETAPLFFENKKPWYRRIFL